jgi:hypothetical protein
MKKPPMDKAIKNQEDIKKIVKEITKNKFYFPLQNVTIEAENIEEAIKILNK